MLFPIGDQNVKGGYKPLISYTLIGLNILIFLYELSLSGSNQLEGFMYEYGTIPAQLVEGENWRSLFTNMFLHGGWMHLIGNMLFLWVFGDNIEAVIGSAAFLVFYILGGVSASLIHVFFNLNSTVPAIGASGAIAAVLGSYLVMFPKSKVKVIVLIFFTSFTIPAMFFLGIWIVQNLFNGLASLGTNALSGTAWWAHIGGFVFGVAAGFFFKKRYSYEYEEHRELV
jgi:membrane associated rhomboid family serine protease